GVTTGVTTGERGTGFAGAANAGTEISAPCESGDEYFHDTSPYLDRCRLWHQRIAPIGWRLQAQRCQRLRCGPVIGITNSGRFRTIQIAPPTGATFLRADADSLARTRLRCLNELPRDGKHDSRDELCRSIVILG